MLFFFGILYFKVLLGLKLMDDRTEFTLQQYSVHDGNSAKFMLRWYSWNRSRCNVFLNI